MGFVSRENLSRENRENPGKPKRREYMKFLTLEDRFGTMEVTLFPRTYQNFGARIRSYGPYLVRGRVERNHCAIGITAEWIGKMQSASSDRRGHTT